MQLRPHRAQPLWSIVLAAGQGKRLAGITRALCGRWMPKQFVALTSKRTLLQETLERTRPLVPPIAHGHRGLRGRRRDRAPRSWSLIRAIEIVRQPTDRGTAAGLMLGLAHVRAREPQADVAVFPADHHVEDPTAWSAAVEDARAASRIAPSGVALLGAPADRPASDLGWIVPGLGLPDVSDGSPALRPGSRAPARRRWSRSSWRSRRSRRLPSCSRRAACGIPWWWWAASRLCGDWAGATFPTRCFTSKGTCGPCIASGPTGCSPCATSG